MVCGIFILRKVLLPRDLSTAHLTTVSMKYFPHTPDDIRQMLEVIGVNSLDDLYAEVPEELKLHRELQIPEAKS